jgi:cobalt/nickel transport system permease protein
VAATLSSLVLALCRGMIPLIAGLTVALLLVILAHLALGQVIRRLLVVAGFIALIWVLLPLTYDEGPFHSWGPIRFSHQGILLSARITLKSFGIVLTFMALVATMTVATLGHALSRLGLPPKLVHLLLITYRYIFVIEAEYRRLYRAARMRGFVPGTNLHTYRTWAYFLGMLFVRASLRAERVFQAMQCRGFHGRFHSLTAFSPNAGNRPFAIAMSIATALIVSLEIFF